MPTVAFTPNLQRHLDCPDVSVAANTVADALEAVFRDYPRLRGYVLDEQGRLRQHVAVFVGGELIRDRTGLSDTVAANQDILSCRHYRGGRA